MRELTAKKLNQLRDNKTCMEVLNQLYRSHTEHETEVTACKRLRTCNAQVWTYSYKDTGEPLYYVLQSYNTIVALIDIETNCVYDVLRYVYGYTATSAQHISKFISDYGRYAQRITYREV